MSKETKPVSVSILDKEYLVSCPEEEQDGLLKTARYLDSKMKEIRDSGKIVGVDRIAVMAALNITHDLLQNQSQNQDLNQVINSRIRTIQEKIERALHNGKQMEL
jgi:cell division protein ZapA